MPIRAMYNANCEEIFNKIKKEDIAKFKAKKRFSLKESSQLAK